MRHGFQWCGHCGRPHALDVTICPTTGGVLATAMHTLNGRAASSPPDPLRRPLPTAPASIRPGPPAQPPARARTSPPAPPAPATARRPPPPQPPALPALVAGKYRLGRAIGSGGYGSVYEAENVGLGRIVALKILTTASVDAARRMRREARVLAGLHHANICDVYDVGALEDGRPFIVLERLRGETLEARLLRERRLSLEKTVQIFTQVLSALQAAHGSGIIHRDLKPANVFLVEAEGCAPIVKLVDFGLAKDLLNKGSSITGSVATRPGVTCGSPPYMSPEQLRGHPLDARSDLFALGVILYEVLGGKHPFFANTVIDLATKILNAPTPGLRMLRPSLPAWVEVVVRRALEKRPSNRFPSAAEMQRALLASESWRQPSSAEITQTITHVAIPRLPGSSSRTPIIS